MMQIPDVMLTTSDNPWNPFTDWELWYAFDENLGYATSGLIARLNPTTTELGSVHSGLDLLDAYHTILELDLFNLYRVVDESGNVVDLEKLRSQLLGSSVGSPTPSS